MGNHLHIMLECQPKLGVQWRPSDNFSVLYGNALVGLCGIEYLFDPSNKHEYDGYCKPRFDIFIRKVVTADNNRNYAELHRLYNKLTEYYRELVRVGTTKSLGNISSVMPARGPGRVPPPPDRSRADRLANYTMLRDKYNKLRAEMYDKSSQASDSGTRYLDRTGWVSDLEAGTPRTPNGTPDDWIDFSNDEDMSDEGEGTAMRYDQSKRTGGPSLATMAAQNPPPEEEMQGLRGLSQKDMMRQQRNKQLGRMLAYRNSQGTLPGDSSSDDDDDDDKSPGHGTKRPNTTEPSSSNKISKPGGGKKQTKSKRKGTGKNKNKTKRRAANKKNKKAQQHAGRVSRHNKVFRRKTRKSK
jgi:hypothetical protein